MSRTTSIAGVRPLGWLARVRAQRSCLADGSGAAGLGPIMALGRERAMSMRVSALGPGQGRCRRLPLHAPELATAERPPREARAHLC
jgi:hypothetical protein